MAIISLVTFLLRLCLYTTDPPSEVEFERGQSRRLEQHCGLDHVLASFNCQTAIDHKPGSSSSLGERMDRAPLHRPSLSTLAVLLQHLIRHVQLAPSQTTQSPEPLLNIVRGRTKQMEEIQEMMASYPTQTWGAGGPLAPHTQFIRFVHTEPGGGSFQDDRNICDFFPQALELCN